MIQLNTRAKEIQQLNPGGPDQRHNIRPQPSHKQIGLSVGTVIESVCQHAIKDESKVVNGVWIGHQACSRSQYIIGKANLFNNGKLFKLTAMKNQWYEQFSLICTLSHTKTLALKVPGAREI